MKKKLIITAVFLATFSFSNAQSINDITKAATSTAASAAASSFDVASIANQVMGVLNPKLKLTEAQKPMVNSLVNQILNKKKNLLPMLTSNKAGYTSKMTGVRESFLSQMKKMVSTPQFSTLNSILPTSAKSTSPLAKMLF